MSGVHEGKVAVVTGAARGIGRAIASRLAEGGARVVLVDRDDPSGAAAAIEGAVPIVADVTSDEDWGRVRTTVTERFGRADIVVNNAGIVSVVPIDELTMAEWQRVMGVNLMAHFLSAKHFVPEMRRNGWGRLVAISSASIGSSETGMSHYMASKMGVIGFVRGLANDVAADGITVNAVLPSLTDTDMTANVPDFVKQQVANTQAIKRVGRPADIAGPVSFLASDDGGFVTGQAIVVDGGFYKIS